MRISDCSSDVCSSDLPNGQPRQTDEERLELKTSRDKARSALALIGRVQPHLDRVKTLYDANLKGAGPVQSLREYLPSQRNAQFDAAVAPQIGRASCRESVCQYVEI